MRFLRSIFADVRNALDGWKKDPAKMLAQSIFSLIVGQLTFWRFGFDQIGIFMNTKWQTGRGVSIGKRINDRLPQNDATAWILKAVEIVADAGKIKTEGACYQQHGYCPDVVACLVTQPLWSTIETVEKATGAILHPERVVERKQRETSIGCIYGSLFRYFADFLLLRFGPRLYPLIGRPIENGLRRIPALDR